MHIARDKFVPFKSVFTKNFPLVQSAYHLTDPNAVCVQIVLNYLNYVPRISN